MLGKGVVGVVVPRVGPPILPGELAGPVDPAPGDGFGELFCAKATETPAQTTAIEKTRRREFVRILHMDPLSGPSIAYIFAKRVGGETALNNKRKCPT